MEDANHSTTFAVASQAALEDQVSGAVAAAASSFAGGSQADETTADASELGGRGDVGEANPDPESMILVDHGLLSDEQTQAMLAEVADVLHKEQQENENKKRKADALLDESSQLHVDDDLDEDEEYRDDKDAVADNHPSPTDSNKMPATSTTRRARSAPTRVSWDERIEQLRAFKAEHGDLLIPIRYKQNPSLGKFVHNTREQYKLFHKRTPANYKKKCSLTQERITQLDQIGFAWTTERSKKQDEDWKHRFEQLKQFKDAHGDCLVPHGYKVDPSFAEWVHRQRTTYALHIKEGRVNPMVEERMKKLEELGFNFRVHVDKWSEHYEQLQEYRKQNGHCMVPTHYTTNMKLGRWVHTQRHQHRLMQRGKKSSMTQERVKLLEELGFSWEVRPGLDRPRVSWHQRYAELEKFHKENGHFGVSPVANAPLYAWCSEQLQRLKLLHKQSCPTDGATPFKLKGMGHDRIKALADIGFTKDVELAPVDCEAGAVALAAAREMEGHSSHDEDDDHDEFQDAHSNHDDEDLHSHHEVVAKNEDNTPAEAADDFSTKIAQI